MDRGEVDSRIDQPLIQQPQVGGLLDDERLSLATLPNER
jgi:hypothetical protein